jgi:hypothetical protein
MNFATRCFSTFVLVAALSSLSVLAAGDPITIQQCFITVPKHFSQNASGTQITYVNNNPHAAALKVTFEVMYRNAAGHFQRRVTDEGNFAPGSTIDHHFALFNDITYAGKQANCKVVYAKFADGTSWSR